MAVDQVNLSKQKNLSALLEFFDGKNERECDARSLERYI